MPRYHIKSIKTYEYGCKLFKYIDRYYEIQNPTDTLKLQMVEDQDGFVSLDTAEIPPFKHVPVSRGLIGKKY